MSHTHPLAHPEVRQARTSRYFTAFFASTVLMLAAYLLTRRNLPYLDLLETLGTLLLFTLVSQTVLFFGLNLSREQIWKSVALALVVPLFIVSIGLTVLVFSSLYARTMLPMDPMAAQPTLLQ